MRIAPGTIKSSCYPIEHRLFSHISLNCVGLPLRSFDTLCRTIEGMQTATGLQVTADLKRGDNETRERVSEEEMRALHVCLGWRSELNKTARMGQRFGLQAFG